VKFVIANTMVWYCFTILLTVFPLYAVFVLGIEEESFLIGIILMVALLASALFIPLQKKIGTKFGMRNGLILGLIIWIITLFPLVLLSKGDALIAIIIFGCIGYGLSSALFYVDIIHADVIDQDALKFGVKRSASYYGINAFIHRISSILSIVTIALVFSGTGWSSYTPVTNNPELTVIGLKLLMFVFPAIALIIAILFFLSFELHGENLKKMREELAKHPELK
jgi:Na+/melibiose symporter-like transporter